MASPVCLVQYSKGGLILEKSHFGFILQQLYQITILNELEILNLPLTIIKLKSIYNL